MAEGFTTGVIEGFYGRVWPWEQRAHLIDCFAAWQLGLYVYAPKSDRTLRRAWREQWSADDETQLRELRLHARQQGVEFGLGLSPWGLQSHYGRGDAVALRDKVTRLNDSIAPDWLCILFDDMPGEGSDLASRQAEIVGDIVAASSARRFAMCPSWYSDDPQLAALFGPQPPGYLETLGRELPPAVDVFWTGPLVVSPGYDPHDFAHVAAQLGRKPLLWDNYPVNDGRRISRFLHLRPLLRRPRALRNVCSGHVLNPMNQPLLSKPALASLAVVDALAEREGDEAMLAWWRQSLPGLVGPRTATLLLRDVERFQDEGLDALEPDEKSTLRAEYAAVGEPAATEVADWLAESYRFDPECLND